MLTSCGLDSNVGITSDELDYFEQVISLSYGNCPSKGLIQTSNNNSANRKSNSYYDSEPNFKGQLSKYFPESIRSNFNEVDFSELEASQLLVFNSIYDMVLNDLGTEDSNSFDSCPTSNNSLETNESIVFVSKTNSEISKKTRQTNNKSDKNNGRIKGGCIAKRDFKEKKIICMKDCLHVWEFLRDLLRDNEHNNKIIRWLDQRKGIFKITDPNCVSLLWGKKKLKKSDMKYPNMARGIRYSREEGGYFDSVSKSLGYGKKLVYKFSKKTLDHCDWLKSIVTEY